MNEFLPNVLVGFELDVQISSAECQLLIEKLKMLAEQDAWPGDEEYISLIPKLERRSSARAGFRWTRTIRAVFDDPGEALPIRADSATQVAHASEHREELHSEITHGALYQITDLGDNVIAYRVAPYEFQGGFDHASASDIPKCSSPFTRTSARSSDRPTS